MSGPGVALPGGLPRESLSVSELNRAVAEVLAEGFPLVRVHGEVGNFTRAASGHWYFTLKDPGAQVRCVMFRGRNALVDFTPRDGDAVDVLARVGLYEARGEYQLNLESMQRAGQGRLYEEFLRRRDKLAAEGLFDAERKRRLPGLPERIGVVTSLQAAALRDVLTALARRAPYAAVVVYPVPVQGADAGARMAGMLATASRRREVDVLLLVRGGGSIEDLWAFNEEVVARAIRACAIPVVVGVGHESDFTIADFAADVRAPTPTAAAELAAPERGALIDRATAAALRIDRYMRQALESGQQRLDYALRSLGTPRASLAALEARVAERQARLVAGLGDAAARRRQALAESLHRLSFRRPSVAPRATRLATAHMALRAAHEAVVQRRRAGLERARQALGHLDPHAVLKRGYAIAFDASGHAVSDAARLQPGDPLRVTLARGAALARVERVERPPSRRGGNDDGAD